LHRSARNAHSRLKVADNIGDLLALRSVKETTKEERKRRADKHVGDRDALPNEPCALVQVLVEHGETLVDLVNDAGDDALVVRDDVGEAAVGDRVLDEELQ